MTYKANLDGKEAELFWDIVENFYRAEAIIGRKITKTGKETSKLMGARKTSPDDSLEKVTMSSPTTGFGKLEELRNKVLKPLKEASHELFRDEVRKTTNRFDKDISHIFHQVSIVKEDDYELTDMGGYKIEEDTKEPGEPVEKRIKLESKKDIPSKMKNIRILIKEAEKELVKLLKQQNRTGFVIASLYLSADELFGDNKGLESLYRRIYDFGSFEGYLTVAEGFNETGHDQEAKKAFDKARYKKLNLDSKRRLKEGYRELDKRYKELWDMLKLKQQQK